MPSDIAMGIGLGKSSPVPLQHSFKPFQVFHSLQPPLQPWKWNSLADDQIAVIQYVYTSTALSPFHTIVFYHTCKEQDPQIKGGNSEIQKHCIYVLRPMPSWGYMHSDLGFKQLVWGARSIRLQCSSTIGTYSCMQFRKLLKTITASEESQ